MSISLLITFAGFRAYFGGDTEGATEVKLAQHHLANGPPQPADLAQAVWINPPTKNTTAQHAPGATIVTVDDLQVGLIRAADDNRATLILPVDANLINSTLVSQCH